MINFRYHLVSLIAVFLALAVGVVLGAGPLQNAVKDMGESQATPVEVSASDEVGEELAESLGAQILPTILENTDIGLVILPDTPKEDIDAVIAMVRRAGAEVVTEVRLTEEFVSQDAGTYRDTLATPVSSYLEGRPVDPTAAGVLATGLVEALTVDSSDAQLIAELLSNEETPLVEKDSLNGERVDALILIGGQIADVTAPLTKDAWLALGQAFADAPVPAVGVGQAAKSADFIAVLRHGASPLTTADFGGRNLGALNAALVLATSQNGAYGTQEGATAVLVPLP